jgi:hypothetical protein
MLVAQTAGVNGAAVELPGQLAIVEFQQSVRLKFGTPGFQMDHFLAVRWFFVRRFNRQSNEVIFEFKNRHNNFVIDNDSLVCTTGNDMHR